jgi:hypothetical protein
MRLPFHSQVLRPALSLAALVWAAACSDAPTASRVAPAPRYDGATAVRTLGRPTLVSNRIKYRDMGYKPAGGRAGSASLYVQALAGRDGKTELQVYTGSTGGGGIGGEIGGEIGGGLGRGGDITHLLVSAFSPNGKRIGTHAHSRDLPGGDVVTLTYGGMARGTRLQVQGTVKGIDPNRTDVPTVTGTVRLRPNVAVQGITAPARAGEGRRVTISATVAETNGDVGAWTDCRLSVDGIARDFAQRVWVDAGDAVTCLFSTVFTGEGNHRVEVRLGDALPRDDDPGDNAASAEVEVYASNELFYSASVFGFESESSVFTSDRGSFSDDAGNSSGYDNQGETRSTQHHRQVSFDGWTPKAMPRMPRVEIAEESSGAPVFSGTFELEPRFLTYGYDDCGQGLDGSAGALVSVCIGELGGTQVSYNRFSTRVTYHSSQYSRTWDDLTGEEMVYHYNYDESSESGLPLQPLGSDFTIRVQLVADDTRFSASSTFPLRTSESRYEFPLSCFTDSYSWPGSTREYCFGQTYFIRDLFGSGSDIP